MKTTKRQSSTSTLSLNAIILLCILAVVVIISAVFITNYQTRNIDTRASAEQVFMDPGYSVSALESNYLELRNDKNFLQTELQEVENLQ